MKELMLAIAGGAAAKEGLLWVLVLFLVCFGAVHAARLALLGWRAVKGVPQNEHAPKKQEKSNENQSEKPSPQEEGKGGKSDERGGKSDERDRKPDETPAPVYLLVEKKRVRKKPKYEEPKRIDLKN